MHVAIYSGSFNPIHMGHLRLASYIASPKNGLADAVWLMVTPLNPLKENTDIASNDDRYNMVRLACDGIEGVAASDFEMHLEAPWYSLRTLRALKSKYPQHSFKIVVGSDNWMIFDRWKDPQSIISEFGVIIYPRPGYEIADTACLPENVIYLPEAPQTDVSSTMIRELIKSGEEPTDYIPTSVSRYISEHNIYMNNSKGL